MGKRGGSVLVSREGENEKGRRQKRRGEGGGERTSMTLIPARVNEQLSIKQQRLSRSEHFGRTAVVRSFCTSPPLLPLSHHHLQRWR